MSIKEIKEKILQDALNEKEKILKDAEVEIANIKNQAKREIESIQKEILGRYSQEAELKEKKIITEANLDSKKDILSEKQNIIADIFSKVLEKITGLEDERYLSLLEALILDNVEIGEEIVYIGNQERKLVNQEFIKKINEKLKLQGRKGNLKLSENRVPIIGGVILATGEIRKNASLEVILEKIKDEIETQLNQFLFTKNVG
jgi:V/A-type H+-transporting ATPase subunit E